jgi:hypothetical protein
VFWLNLIEERPDGILVVENQHDRGKSEIKKVRAALEQISFTLQLRVATWHDTGLHNISMR